MSKHSSQLPSHPLLSTCHRLPDVSLVPEKVCLHGPLRPYEVVYWPLGRDDRPEAVRPVRGTTLGFEPIETKRHEHTRREHAGLTPKH